MTGYLFKENIITREREYKFFISMEDLVKVDLDNLDQRLLDECNNSPNISDKLLALEMIYRKLESQRHC